MILGLLLLLAAPGAAAPVPAAGAAETPWRIVFKNSLPIVKVQDEEAGIFYVKLVFCGDGPVDPNSGRPDYASLPELKTITYGKPIEGKNLPGRAIDISKKELMARKEEDPATLILTDMNRKRTIYEGTIPAGAAWVKVRYDTAIFTRKEGSHFPGARNWIAMPLPIAPEDRWIRLDPSPDPCPTRVLQITALVKGTLPDENDFAIETEARCE